MSNIWLSLLQTLGLAWWIEVKTDDCTYFFGPFASQSDAESEQHGYIEDLEQDGESNIQASLMKGKPSKLTIEGHTQDSVSKPAVLA